MDVKERLGIKGFVQIGLWTPRTNLLHGSALGPVMDIGGVPHILKDYEEVENLVTQYGDQVYGEAAVGIGSHNVPTGMRVGSGGATAAAKTGAGAAIVTYTGTNTQYSAFEGGYPASALNGSSRRISYQAIWAAGEATNASLNEAVVTNENPLTDVAGAEGNTLSRATFTAKDKQAADTLTITWHHDILGA